MVPLLQIQLAKKRAATQECCQVIRLEQRLLVWFRDEVEPPKNHCMAATYCLIFYTYAGERPIS